MHDYALSNYEANILTNTKALADFYEKTVSIAGIENCKVASNLMIGELNAALNRDSLDIESSPITTSQFAKLVLRIADNTLSGKLAKTVFEAMWQQPQDPDLIIDAQGLKQVTDSGAIEKIIDTVIANNQKQLEEYRAGKQQLFGFFVGQVMKASQGKANPDQVNKILQEKLK